MPRILPILFLLTLSPFLRAQDGTRSVRLAWTEDEYALHYEVIIEREEDGGVYRRISREITNDFFIQLTLPPGKYRCHVIPYDFLEKPGTASQWLNFEVQAYVEPIKEPDVTEPEPPEPAELVEEEEAETVEEVKKESTDNLPEPIMLHIIARNDLVVSSGNDKIFNVYLNAEWMPVFPVYHGEQNDFMGSNYTFYGAAVRFGMVYLDMNYINPGLELTGSWYAFDTKNNKNEDELQHAATAAVNMVIRKQLPVEIMAFTFRLGTGFSFLPGSAKPINLGQSVFANAGVSFLVNATKHLYFETGLDYVHLLGNEPAGCLRPWLGIGFVF